MQPLYMKESTKLLVELLTSVQQSMTKLKNSTRKKQRNTTEKK